MLDDLNRLSDRVPDWVSGGALTLMFGALLWWWPGWVTGFAFALVALLFVDCVRSPGMDG